MPTIRDVAEYAGVSVATVSRYLNHSPLIAEASAIKVREAIEELHYQPSMMARGLLHGNSRTIALAVDYSNVETYGNEFFLRIQYGLEHELTKNGYYLMICHIGSGKDATGIVESLIREHRIDGLVLLSELAKAPIIKLLHQTGLPYVIAGRSEEKGVVWTDIDNVLAGRLATEQVLSDQIDRIGFLTNSFQKLFVKERYEGFSQAVRASDRQLSDMEVADGLTNGAAIGRYVQKHRNDLCTAYVASDSMIAFYFLRELARHQIEVPDTVQVIGFDDSVLAEAAEPALTVVKIDVKQLGISAARLLMRQLHGQEIIEGENLLDVSIVVRNSTKS